MFKDLVLKNRSYRGFDKNEKLTLEQLSEFVDCARLAASSVNMQPFKYYLSYEEKEVAAILKNTFWAKGLPELSLPKENEEPQAFIVIMQDKNINDNLNRFQKDVGIVAQTILLAACEAGYGGCMIGGFVKDQIKAIMNQDANLEPLLLIALGKPTENIKLVDVVDNQTGYYRDENFHYVPKRALKDIIITKKD